MGVYSGPKEASIPVPDVADLIAKLESAESGGHALDRAIWNAVEFDHDGEPSLCPAYTTCVSSALGLVARALPGRWPSVSQVLPSKWGADIYDPVTDAPYWLGHSPTPALALCIAALRCIHHGNEGASLSKPK